MNELAPRVRAAAGKALAHVDLLLVIAVVVLGVVTRFHRLDADSLWLDEAITFERSSLPLDLLLKDTIERLHLPVYFVLMHYWIQLGDDEFMMRAPAAVFGCLDVIAAIALGWVLAGRRGGWVLGMLCVLSPALLRYSQEARMYSMFVLATTIGLCGLLWLVKNREAAAVWPFAARRMRVRGGAGRDAGAGEGESAGAGEGVDGLTGGPERERLQRWALRAWIAFVVGAIWAMYSHNTAVFFWAACWLVAGLVWLALAGKRGAFLRNWLIANFVVLLAWTPWLKPLLSQTKRIQEAFWAKFPSQSTIVATLGDLFLFDDKHLLPGAAIALAALLGLWALRRNKTLAGSLLLLALAPPAMILVVSLQRPIWIPRVMLWCSVPFLALAACGIASLRRTTPAVLVAAPLVVAIAVTGTAGLLDGYYSRHHKPRWEKALRYVQANRGENAIVLPSDSERAACCATIRGGAPTRSPRSGSGNTPVEGPRAQSQGLPHGLADRCEQQAQYQEGAARHAEVRQARRVS